MEVTGLDPAKASLDVARAKPGAEQVRWIHGDASALSGLHADLATMTGNVAQAVVEPTDWAATLRGVYDALRPGAYLVFESRDPAYRGWREWNRADSYTVTEISGVGAVESWVELTEVALPRWASARLSCRIALGELDTSRHSAMETRAMTSGCSPARRASYRNARRDWFDDARLMRSVRRASPRMSCATLRRAWLCRPTRTSSPSRACLVTTRRYDARHLRRPTRQRPGRGRRSPRHDRGRRWRSLCFPNRRCRPSSGPP
jgi:SAM-dependent methyltransferase